MGFRGPPKTPTAILRLHGSARAKTRGNEPTPEVGPPDCPDWLSDDAKAVWEQIVPLMADGVLTRDSGNALARYCDAFVRWKAAAVFLREHGDTYELLDKDGKLRCVVQRPEVAIYANLASMLAKLEREFGLTPSSRANIQALPEGQVDDPMEEFLNRGRRNAM